MSRIRTGIKVSGADEVRLLLRRMEGRTTAEMREEMFEVALDVAEIAKGMAPEDTGGLTNSIEVVSNEGTKVKYAVAVTAGNGINGDGHPVHTYAAKVHEYWEEYAVSAEARQRAAEKSARTGYEVGEKFLERAMDEVDGSVLEERLISVLTQINGYTLPE